MAVARPGEVSTVSGAATDGPLVTLRRRADVPAATLAVAPHPEDCAPSLTLGGDARGGALLTFTGTAIEPVAGGTARLRVPGSLGTGDTSLEPLSPEPGSPCSACSWSDPARPRRVRATPARPRPADLAPLERRTGPAGSSGGR
ncbi:hypothetical protein [Streptomyces sp. NPDC054783]